MAAKGPGVADLYGYVITVHRGEDVCPDTPAGGAMAFKLAIICVMAGALLSLRYNVLVLVLAITSAIVFAVVVGIAQADSFWLILLTTMMSVTAVQLGYLAGVAIYAAIEAIRAARARDRNPELRSSGPTWQQT